MADNTFTFGTAIFNCWNTEDDGGGTTYQEGEQVSNLTDQNNGEVTLYAIWLHMTEGLEFTLINNNTEYEVSKGTVVDGEVLLPSMFNSKPVTKIADDAFSSTSITAVQLPQNGFLKEIGLNAFRNTSITTITIPKSVELIKRYAFGSLNLTEVNFNAVNAVVENDSFTAKSSSSEGIVLNVGKDVVNLPSLFNFYGSSGYKVNVYSVNFHPQSQLESIGDNALNGQTHIRGIAIPSSVTAIGAGAFSGATYIGYDGSILLDDSKLETIGATAFSGCTRLSSINLPNSITRIGASAFYNCSSITQIYLGDNLTTIGENAFAKTMLATLRIPRSVESIGAGAFEDITTLTSLSFNAEACADFIEANYVFENTGVSGGMSVVFGKDVTVVPQYIFYTYKSQAGTIVSPRIKSIVFEEGSALKNVKYSAFRDLTMLTVLRFPAGVETIESSVLRGCTGLIDLTIPFIGKSDNASGFEGVFGYIFGYTTSGGSGTVSQYTSGKTTYSYYIPSTIKALTIHGSIIRASSFKNYSNISSYYIASSVQTIEAYGLNGGAVYTELTSIPEGWDRYFTGSASYYPLFLGCVIAEEGYLVSFTKSEHMTSANYNSRTAYRTGRTFAGWTTTDGTPVSNITELADGTVVYANW